MVFVIFVPRGIAGLRLGGRGRVRRRDAARAAHAGMTPDPVRQREVT
jgi:hypothetical protein